MPNAESLPRVARKQQEKILVTTFQTRDTLLSESPRDFAKEISVGWFYTV